MEYSEKGKYKVCRNEICYIDYNFVDFVVGVYYRKINYLIVCCFDLLKLVFVVKVECID